MTGYGQVCQSGHQVTSAAEVDTQVSSIPGSVSVIKYNMFIRIG